MTTSDLPGVMTMRERMLAGQPYVADSEIGALTAAAQQRMAAYNSTDPGDPQARRELLEELLGEVGEDVEVRPPLYLDYGDRITIGPRTFVNFGLTALDVAPITIGADVQIGPHVQLLTPTHPLDAQQRKDKWEGAAPITIGDNVWLGRRRDRLPGRDDRGQHGRRRGCGGGLATCPPGCWPWGSRRR